MASQQQADFLKEHGYIIIRDFLNPQEVESLQSWAQEVHDWVPEEHSEFMPYDVSQYFQLFL